MPPNTTQPSCGEAQEPRPPHRRLALDENRHVVTHGLKTYFWQDIYHIALTVGWPMFFAVAALLFLLLNFGFALLYLLGHHAIANQSPEGLLGAFFFSVETLATVGYGDMHPDMIFARFSRPHARILFAKRAVVRPIDGRMTLMVRAANARQNVIVEAKARMRLMRSETSPEGFFLRKVHDLPLIREQHPIFLLGWSLMHVIDEESPLFGQTLESLKASGAELMLMVEGLDETTAQPMQARYAWPPELILWQHRYVDLMYERDGETHLDYGKFHDVVPL